MDRVHYLGYIIDQHGINVDLAKIQAIRDWPAPMMQEHLSTSASQPANHVSEFKSRVEERHNLI
jgi:hypothetical protein